MIPTVETERLILRTWHEDDFPAYAAFWADADASHNIGGPADELGAWTRFTSNIGHWAYRGFGMWMLEDKQTGESVGQVGMWYPQSWPEREIGWIIYPKFQRRGFAFEAANAAIDFAAHNLGWTTAMSFIRAGNTASIALAEKLGAKLETSLDFRGVAALIYRHNPARFN